MFNGLLDETRYFKYQITVSLVKKYKGTEIELSPVYLHSTTKRVINDKSFQDILYRIDSSINESSGWIVESVKSQCINISTLDH